MKILIVAATRMEVKLIGDELKIKKKINDKLTTYRYAENEIDILIAGMGVISTTFHLTSLLKKNSYNLVLNTGIAGSLNKKLGIGEVVNVISEEFADLGIEKDDGFSTLFESGFVHPNEFPFEKGMLKSNFINGWVDLKKVHGITANKTHSHYKSISDIQHKFSADIESMEGAAVFYVCHNFKIPCLQIRAVSHYIASRGHTDWNIPQALINLKSSILNQLRNLAVPVS